MMSSEQLKAFDVTQAPESLKKEFGDTPFGRACLAAVQLIEVGVRCVEVTLGGWDTHVNNEELVRGRCEILDPAYAALIKELKARGAARFDDRPVGRRIRPHATSQSARRPRPLAARLHRRARRRRHCRRPRHRRNVRRARRQSRRQNSVRQDPHPVEDLHATILHALGIDFTQEIETPIGRPMALSKGR